MWPNIKRQNLLKEKTYYDKMYNDMQGKNVQKNKTCKRTKRFKLQNKWNDKTFKYNMYKMTKCIMKNL